LTSREDALEWTRRFPNTAVDAKVGEIGGRQRFGPKDFGPGEAIERVREMGLGTDK